MYGPNKNTRNIVDDDENVITLEKKIDQNAY